MGTFGFETEVVETQRDRIFELAEQFDSLYKAMFSEVESMMNYYQSPEAVAFGNKVEEARPILQDMSSIIKAYQEFFGTSANIVTRTQEEGIDAVNRGGSF